MIRPGIGQPVPRREDIRFLSGTGRYVEDFAVPAVTHAIVVRSPHAHAKVRSVHTAAAQRSAGVLAVLTGADANADGLGGLGIRGLPTGFGGPDAVWPLRPVLAADRVRYVGDPVALVIAETVDAAKDASELVEAAYDVLPAAATPDAAVLADAVAIWDDAPENICFRHEVGDAAAVNAAMAAAKHVIRISIRNNRLSANPIEPRGAIGSYDATDDRYTLRTSAQNPHRVREILADSVLGIPETGLRVVAGDVGGGFGMKGPVFAEEALVLWASRRVGRPVKWIADRSESFMSDAHGRDQIWQAEMALDRVGNILAIRANADFALGAYLAGSSHVPILLATEIFPSVYRCPAVHVAARGIFTNAPTTSPYRGAGQPEAIYVVERLIERAAEATGMTSEEIRRRNYIHPEAMPYTTPTGQVYDGGEFNTVTEKAMLLADHANFGLRRTDSERRGRLRGFGISYFIEITAIQGDRMEIRLDPSGAVTVLAGTFSHGQGHETVFPQLVSDWLGVSMERIRLVQGDTDRVAYG
ncbi:MAG: xanthine dehydrogenase family protein molybdopterin-binding subunit, partial [Rhodospirillales bacterium]|nr:xanthine dehydrogenase family protein molybdopterin-binding subunit [Rhodospirillales bacterium]